MSLGWRHFPRARARDFHDADTLEVEVDLGFGSYQRIAVRLFGLSAPEVSGLEKPLGLEALETARSVLWGPGFAQEEDVYRGKPCALWTWKQSFSRYVGRVDVLRHGGADDLAQSILERGVARAWDGKAARPTFEQFPVADAAVEVGAYKALLERAFRP